MNFPKSVKVGGKDYKVTFPYTFKEVYNHNGQSDHNAQEIRVSGTDFGGADRHPDQLSVTFWHEVLHCIDWVYNSAASKGLDEETIHRLGHGLQQVLKDNFVVVPKTNE